MVVLRTTTGGVFDKTWQKVCSLFCKIECLEVLAKSSKADLKGFLSNVQQDGVNNEIRRRRETEVQGIYGKGKTGTQIIFRGHKDLIVMLLELDTKITSGNSTLINFVIIG